MITVREANAARARIEPEKCAVKSVNLEPCDARHRIRPDGVRTTAARSSTFGLVTAGPAMTRNITLNANHDALDSAGSHGIAARRGVAVVRTFGKSTLLKRIARNRAN